MKTIIAKDGIRLLMETDGGYYAMTSWLVLHWWIIILFTLICVGIGVLISNIYKIAKRGHLVYYMVNESELLKYIHLAEKDYNELLIRHLDKKDKYNYEIYGKNN